jgi:hypothetical protein
MLLRKHAVSMVGQKASHGRTSVDDGYPDSDVGKPLCSSATICYEILLLNISDRRAHNLHCVEVQFQAFRYSEQIEVMQARKTDPND